MGRIILVYLFFISTVIYAMGLQPDSLSKKPSRLYFGIGLRELRTVHKVFDEFSKDYDVYNYQPGFGFEPFVGTWYVISKSFRVSGDIGAGFFNSFSKDSFINGQATKFNGHYTLYRASVQPNLWLFSTEFIGMGAGISFLADDMLLYSESKDFKRGNSEFALGLGIHLDFSIRVVKHVYARFQYEYEQVGSRKYWAAELFLPLYTLK